MFVVSLVLVASVLFLCGLCATQASAQEIVSLDKIAAQLKLGQSITVTSADGHTVRGKVIDLSSAALRIRSDNHESTFGPGRIEFGFKRDDVHNGAVIGALVGIAVFVRLTAPCSSGCEGFGAPVLAGMAGAGAGIGALVDLLVRHREVHLRYLQPVPYGHSLPNVCEKHGGIRFLLSED